ncbi:LysR family transcriptional regulator [Paraburkholderia unamae]|uniref:LysR family transcriptional regulator for bpeEF and oprC n=1 Tax=Paraburkholderia unamae TaxID=219649 RepID=A0ABX5KLF5_9BURK|nr:LysR family transcriptional regulator for bpeEF and oprC [Paraburkholderia unamae]
MDRLQAMKVFTRVVETNSFTRAADSLGLPRASVSVTIQQLETYLKVRLLQRTTRKLNVTPDGAAYYERCVRVLADIDDIEGSLENRGLSPRGKIRVDLPGALGRTVLMPRVQAFHQKYPDVELMLGFSDRPVDLIREGVDCVIRIGALQDSTLVARRIGLYQAVTVASPRYLEHFGTPRTIEALQKHTSVNYFWARTGRLMEFTFDVDGSAVSVPMKGRISVNDAEAYVAGALEGVGIVQAARFMALPHLQSGALVEVLEQWKPMPMPISVVYPHNRHLSPTVRVFVDWVAELFGASDLFKDEDVRERFLRHQAAHPAPADSMNFRDETDQPID